MIIKKLFAIGAVIAGTVAATAGVAAASTGHPASVARPVAAAQHMSTSRGGPGGEDPSKESDGPGGHQDPAGQNVNHQFQGVE